MSYGDYKISRLFGDMPEHNKQNLPRLHTGAVNSQPVAYMTPNSAFFISLYQKRLIVEPKERKARWPKAISGDENMNWKRHRLELDVALGVRV